MAALSTTDLVTRVLDNVGRVSGDAQLTSTVILRKADDVYRQLRRRISAEFPTIYEKVTAETTLTTTSYIAKPSDCESVRVVERKSGSAWYPIGVSPSLNRSGALSLSFYEQGANIQIAPTTGAAGTYRIHYSATPAASVTTYEVPDGLERIIVEETSAWARQRHNEVEQMAYHMAEAVKVWDEAYMGLWNRYGSHGRSGLNITRT
jgi:hypothetical protein